MKREQDKMKKEMDKYGNEGNILAAVKEKSKLILRKII